MEAHRITPLSDLARELLLKESFLKKLGIRREASGRLLGSVPWTQLTAPLEPITGRISCARALDAFRPLLDTIALPPEKQIEQIKVLSVAPVLAEAVARIYSDKPVSTLFV